MITLHVENTNILQNTIRFENVDLSWDDKGANTLQVDNIVDNDIIYAPRQLPIYAYSDGVEIWRGFIGETTRATNNNALVAYGDIHRFSMKEDYTEFWSETGCSNWFVLASGNSFPFTVSNLSPNSFDARVDDNELYFTLRKDAAIRNVHGTIAAYRPNNNIKLYAANIEYRLPTNFTAYLQGRQADGTFSFNVIYAGNGAIKYGVIFSVSVNVGMINVFLRNDTGGTYTVTDETDHWYVKITDFRAMSDSSDTVAGTLTSAATAGTNATINVSTTEGMYPGAQVSIPSANPQIVTVKTVGASSFTADLRANQPNGAAFRTLRLRSSTIASGIAQSINYPYSTFIQNTDDDITNAIYAQENALEVLESVKPGNYDMYTRKGIFCYVPQTQRDTYLARADQYSTTIDLYNSPGSIRAKYDDKLTGYTETIDAQRYQLTRTKTIDLPTASGMAIVQRNLAASGIVESKSDVTISELRNRLGGVLSIHEIHTPAVVSIQNIIPELTGVKTTYLLKEIRADGDNISYVLDKYPDTIESFLSESNTINQRSKSDRTYEPLLT